MDNISIVQLTQIGLIFIAIMGWLLAPLVPSIIIHKLLPKNEISLSGKLAALNGLTVNASGGIATYVLLFLIVGSIFTLDLIPSIQRLDDGNWEFDFPFMVQDANGTTLVLTDGTIITADVLNNRNPDFYQGGSFGYEAVLHATPVEGRLPTIQLVSHLQGGATATSGPIDLSNMARTAGPSRVVKGPLQPLRSRMVQAPISPAGGAP
jgi:hypothetical protein